MKTLEQIVKEYKSQTLDGRDLNRLVQFIPFNMVEKFGIKPKEEYNNAEKWNANVKPFTKENILAQLREAFSVDELDWLNSHHFDYRGLIEKGLAIEAPEGMYK